MIKGWEQGVLHVEQNVVDLSCIFGGWFHKIFQIVHVYILLRQVNSQSSALYSDTRTICLHYALCLHKD